MKDDNGPEHSDDAPERPGANGRSASRGAREPDPPEPPSGAGPPGNVIEPLPGPDEDPMAGMSQQQINRILIWSTVGVLAVGTVAYHFLEGWSWVDAFYFSAVVLTTVGFGDLTPSSDISKLFTVLYIFSGIAIISTFLSSRLRHMAERKVLTRRHRRE